MGRNGEETVQTRWDGWQVMQKRKYSVIHILYLILIIFIFGVTT